MNLILSGMPRCGKSTLGKAVAEKLGHTYIDIDHEMERIHGLPTRQLYTQVGETAFRRKEHQVIAKLAPLTPSVIVLGGGSLLLTENIRILKTIGTLIYLKISYQLLLERIQHDPLTFMKDIPNDLEVLMRKRCPIYESAADHIFEVPKLPIENQAAQLIKEVRHG